jgi:hypothetical protein
MDMLLAGMQSNDGDALQVLKKATRMKDRRRMMTSPALERAAHYWQGGREATTTTIALQVVYKALLNYDVSTNTSFLVAT